MRLIWSLPSLKLTQPLKMNRWKTILSFWCTAHFWRAMLVSGRVFCLFLSWGLFLGGSFQIFLFCSSLLGESSSIFHSYIFSNGFVGSTNHQLEKLMTSHTSSMEKKALPASRQRSRRCLRNYLRNGPETFVPPDTRTARLTLAVEAKKLFGWEKLMDVFFQAERGGG